MLSVLSSCGEDKKEDPLDVDVSEVKVSLEYHRLDQELAQADTNSLDEFNQRMLETYNMAWVHYAGGVLRQGDPRDPMFSDNFKRFFSHPFVNATMNAVDSTYGDVSDLNKQIEEGFKHLKYYYKDALMPKIVYTNNFFNYYTNPVIAVDSMLLVGLDFYLGKDHWLVKTLPMTEHPQYIRDEMSKEFVVVNAMKAWFQHKYLPEPKHEDFLEALIYNGKLMYAMDALMPDIPDHVKLKYSKSEMEWCVGNENRIWLTLVDRDLIHNTNQKQINDYFRKGPFTPSLKGNDTPDRVGMFMGWSIVKDYMAEHTDKSLVDLLKEKNNQSILNSYKQGK